VTNNVHFINENVSIATVCSSGKSQTRRHNEIDKRGIDLDVFIKYPSRKDHEHLFLYRNVRREA